MEWDRTTTYNLVHLSFCAEKQTSLEIVKCGRFLDLMSDSSKLTSEAVTWLKQSNVLWWSTRCSKLLNSVKHVECESIGNNHNCVFNLLFAIFRNVPWRC